MFFPIWMALLFSLRDIKAGPGAAGAKQQSCHSAYCVTLHNGLIRGEAGLCAVIPCTLQFPQFFKPTSFIWSKCESKRCSDSDIIFHSNNYKSPQPGFLGRVSLLDPNVSHSNCGIMINDLQESDSGSYQLRVNGLINKDKNGLTFNEKSRLSVRALHQNPTVMVPDLTQGQRSTLTCTAPGLCSGSPPNISWVWRGAAEEDVQAIANVTANKNETLSALMQQHSSALIISPGPELHNSSITCRVSFGAHTTEETVHLHINYMRISGNADVSEGMQLNLTCMTTSSPHPEIRWDKFRSKSHPRGRPLYDPENNTTIYWQDGRSALFNPNVTPEDSGLYICRARHLEMTLQQQINVTVKYGRKAHLSGRMIVKEGDSLNLTCSRESFPPSLVLWTKLSSDTQRRNTTALASGSASATLIISNATAEDSGTYVCSAGAEKENSTETRRAEVTVILKESKCLLQGGVLTCICIAQTPSSPKIRWPMVSNFTKYAVTANVSGETVRSSLTFRVDQVDRITAGCIVSTEREEVEKKLKIHHLVSKKNVERYREVTEVIVSGRPDTIISFFIGLLTSALIFGLGITWFRKKKNSRNAREMVELAAGRDDPVVLGPNAAVVTENEGIVCGMCCCKKKIYEDIDVKRDLGRSCQDAGDSVMATGEGHVQPCCRYKEAEYANIDFSCLKKTERPREREPTTTEYTEICIKPKQEERHSNSEDSELTEDQEEMPTEEDYGENFWIIEDRVKKEEAVYAAVRELESDL